MSPRTSLPRFRDRLVLRDGLRVSPFCLGIATRPEYVVAAYDAGINFFFVTADMHWPLYRGVREGLALLLSRRGGIRGLRGGIRLILRPVSHPCL